MTSRSYLRAFRHRNYRLYFSGQSISMVGAWMTRVATSWLVYRLTGSALLLGVVGFAGQILSFVLSPIAGVLVDRWDKHKLLIWTQILAMIQALIMGILVLKNAITIEEIIVLSVLQGMVNAFEMPVRQSFVVRMVNDKADLSNAIALNSSLVNLTRAIGPSVAGVLIAVVGEAWCFLADAISYLAVLTSLFLMRLEPDTRKPSAHSGLIAQMREGWRYVVGFAPIKTILIMLGISSIAGMSYPTIMPIFATRILHGAPSTLGLLLGSAGLGSLGGALYLASRKTILGLGRIIPKAAAFSGLALIAFAYSHVVWLSVLMLFLAGFGFMVQVASTNTLVQTVVEDDKRGRVMSFYAMAFVGTAPFGSLITGAVAARFGAPFAVSLGGVGCLLGALWFARSLPTFRNGLRPIYIQMGILPDPASIAVPEAAAH
ncbi:MFS transporter [Capsulimonas corticalis]|uniref:MFS transporter n=1 Tax=Capsulimonas corticalis TaxID=2219043 RepID=A0A402CWQ8_9BACT|nr:MFS transporter [Capsulimonas corticalis]BDI34199.1 MFS transporter [Capsulimonas corticalis]